MTIIPLKESAQEACQLNQQIMSEREESQQLRNAMEVSRLDIARYIVEPL